SGPCGSGYFDARRGPKFPAGEPFSAPVRAIPERVPSRIGTCESSLRARENPCTEGAACGPAPRPASGQTHPCEFPLAHLVDVFAARCNLEPTVLDFFTVDAHRPLPDHAEGLGCAADEV